MGGSTAQLLLAQVENIDVPNWGRYNLNWVKLRVWEWEEFNSLVLLDVDAVVRGSLAHLFSLPTNFAWAAQNGHTGFAHNRGGVIMLRPCRVPPRLVRCESCMRLLHDTHTVSTPLPYLHEAAPALRYRKIALLVQAAKHMPILHACTLQATLEAMLHVVTHIEYYQFKHRMAEQDFLDWCVFLQPRTRSQPWSLGYSQQPAQVFHYTRFELPTRYNLNFKFLDDDGLGPGGLHPAVIHFPIQR